MVNPGGHDFEAHPSQISEWDPPAEIILANQKIELSGLTPVIPGSGSTSRPPYIKVPEVPLPFFPPLALPTYYF